ncbi:unnamed protein product [Cuscuta campestris]|uniref:PSII 6.1 kDa protein n=1 Tax=Cuscuta campestris TaxID=132261 RepID=A0A484K1J6_9ASTE|nr:unnamed protein product [Cuscuta campestris]
MAAISACATTSVLARAALVPKSPGSRPSSALGLPAMRPAAGKVRCSAERKGESESRSVGTGGGGASLIAAAAAALVTSPAAMALVDERMGTEGTGLPFGLNNNLLGWVPLGVVGLIWSLYMVYISTLDEDEESGLSL